MVNLNEQLAQLRLEIDVAAEQKRRLAKMGLEESAAAIESAIDDMILEARFLENDIDFQVDSDADFRLDLSRDAHLAGRS
tara:strand:- start:368 stop:607 length:240 start_codon:yes stop_codon:yes gene_type:complete